MLLKIYLVCKIFTLPNQSGKIFYPNKRVAAVALKGYLTSTYAWYVGKLRRSTKWRKARLNHSTKENIALTHGKSYQITL